MEASADVKLLIVEDEVGLAKQLKWGLMDHYKILLAHDRQEALKILEKTQPQIVSLDLGLPPDASGTEEGFKLMRDLLEKSPQTKVVVVTGATEKESALKAIELGAYDFYQKPIDLEEFRIILERAVRLQELEDELHLLRQKDLAQSTFSEMIGSSSSMVKLFETARKVARTDYSVLIQGESGTGKERLANAIYNLSPRSARSFVIINCGAIPENLLESELFGHEKGAFTGAYSTKPGKLELAHEGTAFLDEIGELPLQLQVKLLRFLQEGTIERVGGRIPIHVDSRIIAATNVDLEEAVKNGTFREDLFYRLNVVPLRVPPLRERPEDIPLLAHHFFRLYSSEVKTKAKKFSPACVDAMMKHDWPGNIRELQNRIKRAVIMCETREIESHDLDLAPMEEKPVTLREARDRLEAEVTMRSLARNAFNISRAAQELQVSRPTLHDLIKKHNLNLGRDSQE